MSQHTGTFTAPDGKVLFTQWWLPNNAPPVAVVLLVHGVAEHSGRYLHVAGFLTARGYAVYTLDLRGHGRSPGRRAHVESYTEHLDDLATYLGVVRASQPGLPVIVLGHSMGGILTLAFTARHQSELAGMITSAAPVNLRAVTPLALRLAGQVMVRVVPGLPFVQLSADDISRDAETRRAYDADPLNFRGKLSVRQGVELLALADDARAGLPGITIPALCLHGGADRIAHPSALDVLEQELGAADKTIRLYEGMYHEIFNEIGREQVLADLGDWLDARW